MEPLLHSHGAAAVFAGHVHAYERTHPISPASPPKVHQQRGGSQSVQGGVRDDVHGVVYVTIGDGGNREGLYDGWIVDESEEPPDWVDFRNGSHYGRGVRIALFSILFSAPPPFSLSRFYISELSYTFLSSPLLLDEIISSRLCSM